MKQIYYVIQTLLRGRGSNIIKIISLGLSLTMDQRNNLRDFIFKHII